VGHSLKSPRFLSNRWGPPQDWFSRRVLAWRVSITMETDFCLEALREAMDRHGRPEIFNTDQGAQFTSSDFVDELVERKVRISMDGRGRYLDNIFIERLWRSLKYEEVFIKAYGAVIEARRSIGKWFEFYNDQRPHQALDYRTPSEIFVGEACEHVDNASASPRGALALPTCSQAHQREKEVIMY
jgi:putative transposase